MGEKELNVAHALGFNIWTAFYIIAFQGGVG